ncbi:MAG TPA: hypothetical protein VEI03_19365 [Stellaceae bacterium]|nr:hypothetical protein [Stellaceae bacterium]
MLAWLARTVDILRPLIQALTWIAALAHLAIWAGAYAQTHELISELPSLATIVKVAPIIQTIAILMLVIALKGPPPKPEAEYRFAIAASQQFAVAWSGVWIALFFFWLVRSGAAFVGSRDLAHYSLDVLSMAAAGLVLLSYLTMVVSSAGQDSLRWFQIVIRVILGCAAFILAEFLASIYTEKAHAFFDACQGLFAGVMLALLIGRFESKLIGSPIWIVALLYAYAVLQFAYPIIVEHETDDVSIQLRFLFVSSIALFLKILLFWHVRRIVVSGQLTDYMLQYRQLSERVLHEKRRNSSAAAK